MITRRCSRREFLLRPDEETNAIFDYCLAEAAARYEIGIIAWKVLSNHYHAVVHDPHGRLPAFLEHLHKMVAKAMNHRWDRWENFWSSEETCVTHLVTVHDILDKVLYVLCNCIASDLVGRIADWPGSSSLGYMSGKTTVHKRPRGYFREDGAMPAQATLRLSVPPRITKRESTSAWWKRVRAALVEREKTILAQRAKQRRAVLGRKNVLRALPTQAPPKQAIHRKLRPCIACKHPKRRKLAITALREFRARYAAIRERWIAGDRRAVFPAGSYRMRVLGQRCAPFV